MAKKIRHKTVSVGVIFDPDLGFLLFYNKKWGQYAFCMKKPKPSDSLGEVALVALAEDSPLWFPTASARPLLSIGAFGKSGSVGEDTYYDYHVYELDPGPVREGPVTDPNAKFFQYPALLQSEEITWSTKEIARAMMEFQEVCLAVVSRRTGEQRQFLLIFHPSYGYFFPSARRKTNDPPEAMASQAIAWDTTYEGDVQATWCQEVRDKHQSQRFGLAEREYHFHICPATVAGVDLNQADNPFAAALDAFEQAKQGAGQPLGSRGYWDWFTEEEMRNDEEISSTMQAVLPTVLACGENG